jgi:acetyl esterase/lipase
VPTLLAVLAACASGSEGKLSPTATPAPVSQTLVRYGDDASQVADLLVPSGGAELPVVVLIHGGFWQEPFKRDLMDGLARDLADRGFATLKLEYRRVGASEGGWPETALDVAAGIDLLAELASEHGLDTARVAVVGHSAGGQLALWAAGRRAGVPGGLPVIQPAYAVSLAGVLDLEQADRTSLGGGAVASFLERDGDRAAVYPEASSRAMLPLGAPQLVVHGTADRNVPLSQSESYFEAAREAGDEVEFLMLPGADHFALIDARSSEWAMVADRLEVALGLNER